MKMPALRAFLLLPEVVTCFTHKFMAQHSILFDTSPDRSSMPAVPFPFYTCTLLLILLLRVCLQRAAGYRSAATFIGGCVLLVFMAALRWQYDAVLLRQLQSIIAIALPPLAWRCFARLTLQNRQRKFPRYLIAPLIALVLNLAAPTMTDVILMLLYMGYGAALIRTARQGADAFVFTRLQDAGAASLMTFIAGCFLCFSGLTDLAIAIDYGVYQGQQAPQLVALSQAVLLPFICVAIVYSGKKVPSVGTVMAEPAEVIRPAGEDAEHLCQRIEARIDHEKWFLQTDLTLNTLARKLGIPARQISQAVNQARGCNVSQWINRFRILYAQRLLLESTAPVTDIMLDAGFATKSNFNREFARISGMTPTDYRRAAVGMPAPD
ncbi:helix-turn-helix domain-containing protein [Kosakonia sp. BK9b]